MKLFEIISRHEGFLPITAILQVGKHYEFSGRLRGWYICINLPFVKKHIPNFMDPATFTEKPMDCFYRIAINHRNPHRQLPRRTFYNRLWAPVHLLKL